MRSRRRSVIGAVVATSRSSAVYETMPTPGYNYQSWMLAEVARHPERRSTKARRPSTCEHVAIGTTERRGPGGGRRVALRSAAAQILDDVTFDVRRRGVHRADRLQRRRQDDPAAGDPRTATCRAPAACQPAGRAPLAA